MATNQIVPFATGSGANVQDLASFTAASSTSLGYSSGVASSAALNRTWRQSSFMAAGLAGLLTANGFDVPDDGNLTALTNNLKNLFAGTATSQKLPGGFLAQWGNGVATVPGGVISFPMAFPSSVSAVLLGNNGNGSGFIWTGPASLSNFTAYCGTLTNAFSWLAIGR